MDEVSEESEREWSRIAMMMDAGGRPQAFNASKSLSVKVDVMGIRVKRAGRRIEE